MPTKTRTGRVMKGEGEKGPGRPTIYSAAKAAAILDDIANNKTPATLAATKHGLKWSTFYSWVREDRDGLRDKFIAAREAYLDALADECLEIADDGTNDYVEKQRRDGSTYQALDSEHVQRSALRISVRKWLHEVGPKPRTQYGKTEDDANATVRAEALAILERLASAKAAA